VVLSSDIYEYWWNLMSSFKQVKKKTNFRVADMVYFKSEAF